MSNVSVIFWREQIILGQGRGVYLVSSFYILLLVILIKSCYNLTITLENLIIGNIYFNFTRVKFEKKRFWKGFNLLFKYIFDS